MRNHPASSEPNSSPEANQAFSFNKALKTAFVMS